jgi:outer membrane biogenesis lipoprotein LolB
MTILKMIAVAGAIGVLTACSTPQEKAADAQAGASEAQKEIAQERLKLVDNYQTCVKQAGADQQKAAACESYLKAADALK